ncbi:MAG: Spy/CpxP family protein refolding chaperone [Paracoccaceae bacterium]
MRDVILTLTLLIASAGPTLSEPNHQPYKGFEAREIASLSGDDLDQLTIGAGWGLALPAELNGFPGPRHVLELASELGLTPDQERHVTRIFDDMQNEAISAGGRLIEAERQLDMAFRSGSIDQQKLRHLVKTAEGARSELRIVHLSRHLDMLDILSAAQVAKYAVLRGYTADPCDSVPEGHDATMWRRHNGCSGN